MTALSNMQKRLNYRGGIEQQSRMIEDKLKSLKRAYLYSYQAAIMMIDNPNTESELQTLNFRCLMNPDKRTFDTDKMMLSVPFEDICLNADSAEEITVPIAAGKTFVWQQTDTRWIVVLQYIEEYAYFRADVRKCFEYPLDINGNSYYFASVGEKEEILEWTRRNREEWNKMNYTRTLYIERDETTLNYFKRFKVVQIPNIDGNLESWEVQAVNHNAVDDILIVHVKEYFENQYQEVSDEEQEKIEQEHQLEGDFVCRAYDKIKFVTDYIENAEWEIRNKTDGLYPKINDAIVKDEKTTLYIQLMNSKTGDFDVYYNNQLINHVVVEPF